MYMQNEENIVNRIYYVRGIKVMLDSDLAELFEIETKSFNQAVKRNLIRFPEDFMFELTEDEWKNLRSQIVTSSSIHGGRRYLPKVFTEQGVAMLSGILNSPKAIETNIRIVRIFTKLRELLYLHKDVLLKLEQLEKQVTNNTEDISQIFIVIKQLINHPTPPREPIGFKVSG